MMPAGNLVMPLLLQFDGGQEGSGFYFRDGSNSAYIVTAKHVIYDGKKFYGDEFHVFGYSKGGLESTNRYHNIVNLAALQADQLVRLHPTHDIAICKIGTVVTNASGQMVLVTQNKYFRRIDTPPGGELEVAPETVTRLKDVPIGNEVYIFGYPSSIGMQQVPQIEYEKPLLRRGIVAGRNFQAHTLILDCPVYYGNSGGPVMVVNPIGFGGSEFKVVGVVTQFVPFVDEWKNTKHGYTNIYIQNSGYSVAEPMDVVVDLCW